MTLPRSSVIDHIASSIIAGSRRHGDAMRTACGALGAPTLAELGAWVASAQHRFPIACERRILVIAAASAPGESTTSADIVGITCRALADGSAAVSRLARAATTTILLIDAGVADPAAMPGDAVRVCSHEATPAERIEAGIAVAVSVVDAGVDVLGVGAIGEHAAMFHAGLLLGAASMHVPVLLDGETTQHGLSMASQYCADVTDYVQASHPGGLAPPRPPILSMHVGQGEGCGPLMVIPLLDQLAAFVRPG